MILIDVTVKYSRILLDKTAFYLQLKIYSKYHKNGMFDMGNFSIQDCLFVIQVEKVLIL